MTRYELLKEVRDMAAHNVTCYEGKEEYKQEFERETAKLELCERMMAEVQYRFVEDCELYGCRANAYIGNINGWMARPKYDYTGHYIDKLHFSVLDGRNEQPHEFDVAVELQDYFLSGQYDIDRHERYDHPDGNKGSMVKLTVARNTVVRFEWWEPGDSPFVGAR